MRAVTVRVVLVGVALTLGACGRTASEEEAPRVTLEALRAQVRTLEEQKGEDAYTDPSLDSVLQQLDALAEGGPQAEDAHRYSRYLWAKRRLALKAQEGGREPDESVVLEGSRGPLQMKGEAPTTAAGAKRAEQVKVGTPRRELVQALGSCLVRATWFRGTGGGPTTELFHLVPSCRERLGERVFTVANDRVTRVRPGNLDGLLTRERRDAESREEPL
ncbi:MAG: hypothetical protein L0Y66_13415 [Myxococcaceae bacterium]|nr:hypothetical protein [Myxococcaceae bacterium]MCI0671567.1 hypothetical protein [Myxococcaceae bacterium]